jgi:iron complex transport system ATP-binding protein
MPVPPVLQIQDITFRRGREILKGISWTVQQGEHWCILGANGCGKSTLLHVITGYDHATSGSICIDGATYGDNDWREVRKRVGLVTGSLQQMIDAAEPVLHVVASGRDAKLNLWQRPPRRLLDSAKTLLQRFGCHYLADARWGPLSQGEKQKVLICRALMAQFKVLILDEPCAGLDPLAREHFLQWVESLSHIENAPALVMVTHHVEEILPCMTQALLLKEGHVLAAGPMRKVLSSTALSGLYGAQVKLKRQGSRYALKVCSDLASD